MKKINVGMVGVGGIANGVHIPGYLQSRDGEVVAICDINPAALARTAERLHIPPERCFADYHELIACPDVEVVDIATPDVWHCPIAMEAIRQHKPVSMEKPMGRHYAETVEVYEAAKAANVPAVVSFSWRYRPYIRMMRDIVSQGTLGELYHVYVRCIKDSGLWEGRPLEWRFDGAQSGQGVLGDLASHMIDIVRFMGEEFQSVSADAGIFVKERPLLDHSGVGKVTTYDWCNILGNLQSGANAVLQISRTTKNIGDWIQVELFGSEGRLIYCFMDGEQSLEIQAGPMDSANKGAHTLTPSAKYQASQSQAFLDVVQGCGDGLEGTIDQGVAGQRVLEAALCAIEKKRWVNIEEIKG